MCVDYHKVNTCNSLLLVCLGCYIQTVMVIHGSFPPQRNVKEMMDVNGIRVLVDLLTLAHLHTSRAVVPFQVMLYYTISLFFLPCN